MAWRDTLTALTGKLEEATGYTVQPRERVELLEASDIERRTLQRDLDLLAYTALDYVAGRPQDLRVGERRKLEQQARVVWMRDPLAGAAQDLMNDFVFGRGLQKPKCADPDVQKVVDEAWNDPDNQEVLTTLDAQVKLGTELGLSANLFFKVFDDGDDGKVKLSRLRNSQVENVVYDPEVPDRVLWYVAVPDMKADWDYETDQPEIDIRQRTELLPKIYYAHWRNLDVLREEVEAGVRSLPNMPPPDKIGEGRIYHVAINRSADMAFGHPPMDRLLRWYTAYSRFVDARVDIMEASAAFVMKRKVKGTPAQLQKAATQALSRRSALGATRDPEVFGEPGPKPASVLVENEAIEHEPFSINTNAGQAAQDAQMLRASVSASTRFPQSFYGDASNSNLATATSLELPVLKGVEGRQEKFEATVRWFIDCVIDRAVDVGRISKTTAPEGEEGDGSNVVPMLGLGEAHEDTVEDEAATERDLSYEFSMPSPLKRQMGDLMQALATLARTFDPNNTNPELSKLLLGIALSEGLEIEEAARAVERIFPEGYVDPAVAAAQQAQGAPPGEPTLGQDGQPTATGADGQQHGAANPYGAPMQSSPPGMQEGVVVKLQQRGRLDERVAQVGALWDELSQMLTS